MPQFNKLNEKILQYIAAYQDHMDSRASLENYAVYKHLKGKCIGEMIFAKDFQAHLLTLLCYDIGSQRRQVIAQLQTDVCFIFFIFVR